MTVIERKVHFGRGKRSEKVLRQGPEPVRGRVPRISKLMALAITFEELMRSGAVRTFTELAELGHVSPARITQIMNLLLLAPEIQERLLFLPAVERGRDPVLLRDLQAVAREAGFRGGELWRIRGRIGKSLRTYRRSVYGQLIELHPDENGRMEFKPFEMTPRLDDFAAYFLLWLELLLDEGLKGRASYQSRVYDLGCIALDGLAVETVIPRVTEVLERAPDVLASYGFDPQPLEEFQRRLDRRRVPADDLIESYEKEGSIEGVLRNLTDLIPPQVPQVHPTRKSLAPASHLP